MARSNLCEMTLLSTGVAVELGAVLGHMISCLTERAVHHPATTTAAHPPACPAAGICKC